MELDFWFGARKIKAKNYYCLGMLKHALIYPELLQLPLGCLSRFSV